MINIRCILFALMLSLPAAGAVRAAESSEPVVVESALLQLIQQVAVPARAAGVLSSVDVVEGDLVAVGDTLARLDDEEATLFYRRGVVELELVAEKAGNDVAVRAAEKGLAFARAERARLERAATNLPGSVSVSELEERRLKADQSELELEQSQHEQRLHKLSEKLKRQELSLGQYHINIRKISAPLPGMVVEVLRQPGEWVEPGDKVVRIVRIDRLRADGLVHVRHTGPGLTGSAATVAVSVPGQEVDVRCEGRVVFVSPEVNPVNGLVRISVEFDNPQQLLKPGLRAQIMLPAQARRERPPASVVGGP